MSGIAIITEACIDVKDRACVDVCPSSIASRAGRAYPGPALQRGTQENIKGRSKMNKVQLEQAVGR